MEINGSHSLTEGATDWSGYCVQERGTVPVQPVRVLRAIKRACINRNLHELSRTVAGQQGQS